MVETRIDHFKPSPLTLTEDEIKEIQGGIAKGELPPDWFDRCADARDANVFGHDFKIDRNGVPIEQGVGSNSQMTQNSVDAYKKWHGPHSDAPDPDFDRHVARMEKLLAEQDAKRPAGGVDEVDRRKKRLARR